MTATDAVPPPVPTVGDLSFVHPFRRYQQLVVDAAVQADASADRKYHLCAPPGSGKTVIGLELIRRFGERAVVFAPTTTIVQQWAAEVGLFTDRPERYCSTDPTAPGEITVLTYQSISSSRSAAVHLREAARAEWVAELVSSGRSPDEVAATDRLDRMAASQPAGYRRELARHAARLKREMLREGGHPDVRRFLHRNAAALVDRLVDHGVRTVVLDECHHLLDYWAVVLQHLCDRVGPGAHVVGLTATLPDPSQQHQADNYAALLGPVDIEVPTPAVVKEGELAPYRDLVAIVEPTGAERAYLDDVQGAFTAAVAELTTGEAFVTWLVEAAARPALAGPDSFARWLRDQPVRAVAVLRVAGLRGLVLPPDVAMPVEGLDPPHLEDWTAVLEAWALEVLSLSAAEDDRRTLQRLREVLAPFGLHLTERGVRQGRSPGDLVLALSDAKHRMAARILAAEDADLGADLRAVVVCDFEVVRSLPDHLQAVLGAGAGSARRLHATLLEDPVVASLTPVLMTGRTVRVGPAGADELVLWLNSRLAADGGRHWVSLEGTGEGRALAVAGHGGGWSPRVWVPLLTAAFEEGVIRCLVATRGLVGEGWSSRRANTLLDLTGVTTSAATRQLRGRVLRLDPAWPDKVAHVWDVVAVAPAFERGDTDLDRFRRRHERWWGVVEADDAPADAVGAVVRGVAHVDPVLAAELAARPLEEVDLAAATERSFDRVGHRDATRRRWGIGAGYVGRWEHVVRVGQTIPSPPVAGAGAGTDVVAVRLPGAVGAAVDGGRASLRPGLAVAAVGAAGGAALPLLAPAVVPAAVVLPGVGGALVAVAAGVAGVVGAARRWRRSVAAASASAPAGEVAVAMARAVAGGLVAAGLVAREVRVASGPGTGGAVEVWLEVPEPAGKRQVDDGGLFARALGEVLGPIGDPRYLLTREPAPPPDPGWLARRLGVVADLPTPPDAYHRVPEILAVNRERAEAFASCWAAELGGGRLVYAHSEEGRRAVLDARAQRLLALRGDAFERWR